METDITRERPPWVGKLVLCIGLLAVLSLTLAVQLRPRQVRKFPDRIPVTIWHTWTGKWTEDIEANCAKFNELQDKYEAIPLSVPPEDMESKLLLSIASGDPPDAVWQWQQIIPQWADKGVLTQIDTLMSPTEWEEYRTKVFPIAMKIGMYKGHLYGILPYVNVWNLYYRVDDLKAAGLDPNHLPQTLEELMEWGDKLNRFDKNGKLTHVGFMPGWWQMYAPVFGGGFYDWKTGKMTIDTPQNLRALEYLVEARKKLGFNNVIRFETGTNAGGNGADWPFVTGAYSITVDGMWRVSQLSDFAPNLKYVTGPIPPPAGGKANSGWSACGSILIPKGSKHSHGSWEFVKFVSGYSDDPRMVAPSSEKHASLPAFPYGEKRPHFVRFVKKHPQYQTFVDTLPSENLDTTPPVAYQRQFYDKMTSIYDEAVRGLISPREAVKQLDSFVRKQEGMRKELRCDD